MHLPTTGIFSVGSRTRNKKNSVHTCKRHFSVKASCSGQSDATYLWPSYKCRTCICCRCLWPTGLTLSLAQHTSLNVFPSSSWCSPRGCRQSTSTHLRPKTGNQSIFSLILHRWSFIKLTPTITLVILVQSDPEAWGAVLKKVDVVL